MFGTPGMSGIMGIPGIIIDCGGVFGAESFGRVGASPESEGCHGCVGESEPVIKPESGLLSPPNGGSVTAGVELPESSGL
jgi:hypothetical protein